MIFCKLTIVFTDPSRWHKLSSDCRDRESCDERQTMTLHSSATILRALCSVSDPAPSTSTWNCRKHQHDTSLHLSPNGRPTMQRSFRILGRDSQNRRHPMQRQVYYANIYKFNAEEYATLFIVGLRESPQPTRPATASLPASFPRSYHELVPYQR